MIEPEKNANHPRHIAIIMDGNGRWARKRNLPRAAGHRAGVRSLKNIVEHCARRHIECLTVFAFSSENWQRPQQEVRMLIHLFVTSLRDEVEELYKNNIRLSFIGGRDAFPPRLREAIDNAERRTHGNDGLHLIVAANYGGRWDITRACREIAAEVADGRLSPADIDESTVEERLCLAGLPEPDLFVRTGGEQRISNYLLWQCAYAELYFCETLWPDFSADEMDKALEWYAGRQRRFGRIVEQAAGGGDA